MIRDQISQALKQALAVANLPVEDFFLEHPADLSLGDYASNIALILAKKHNHQPLEVAGKIIQEILRQDYKWLAKAEVAGPGFVNFYLSPEFFQASLNEILKADQNFGALKIGAGKKVLVEYSSPNIAKPFGIGHLRSTIIGEAVANILNFSGYEVVRDNYLGDWGTQFGKLIVALKKWGNLDEAQNSPEPIKYLVGLYVRFHDEAEKDKTLDDEARAWFLKLEQGDQEARNIWQTCVDLSLLEFNRIYERLGTKFDSTRGESFFEDKMPAVIEELRQKDLLKKSEGAELVFFPQDKLPPLMVIKSDGSTLYATRDLATDKYRLATYGPEIIIVNEVGSEQSLYFRQLFELEKMLGWFQTGQRIHIAHGLIRGKEGKLSTRKGDAIWLEEVLTEAVKRAGAFNPDTAEAVGIGALKYNDLKRESQKDIIFDWNDILNLEGNSGPYLQYTYARAKSLLVKAGVDQATWSAPVEVGQLERLLYRFPEVVEHSAQDYAPHHLCTYLYELAATFNNFYNQVKIIGAPDEAYRLALTTATAQILGTGLDLLGISAPERM